MSRAAAPAELLAALGRVFGERAWRWYVFGAQAVIAYGRPRLTADVDVTVELAGGGPDALVAALSPSGFELRFPLSPARLREARLLPMVHAPTAMPLYLVIAGAGIDEEFLDRVRLIDLGGVEVPVISAEDLVAVKVLAGRRKDLEDVRGVLVEQHGRLDLARTRDVLGAFEASLDDRKLLPRLERLLRATAAEVAGKRARGGVAPGTGEGVAPGTGEGVAPRRRKRRP